MVSIAVHIPGNISLLSVYDMIETSSNTRQYDTLLQVCNVSAKYKTILDDTRHPEKNNAIVLLVTSVWCATPHLNTRAYMAYIIVCYHGLLVSCQMQGNIGVCCENMC